MRILTPCVLPLTPLALLAFSGLAHGGPPSSKPLDPNPLMASFGPPTPAVCPLPSAPRASSHRPDRLPRGHNCHYWAAQDLMPGLKIGNASYVGPEDLMKALHICPKSGIPLRGTDLSKLRGKYLLVVKNGSLHAHSGAFIPGEGLLQGFDTDAARYQRRFETAEEFLNQNFPLGVKNADNSPRQPFKNNVNIFLYPVP